LLPKAKEQHKMSGACNVQQRSMTVMYQPPERLNQLYCMT
jgi:hypothetical protein